MDNANTLSITDADFYLKRKPALAVPEGSRLLLRHEMNLEGIVVEYEVRLSSGRTGSSLWQLVYDGGTQPIVAGRIFKADLDMADPAALTGLAEVLVRSRWPYEVAGRATKGGIIAVEVWNTEVDAFAAEHEAAAAAARSANEVTPSALIETAKSLRLSPQPAGERPHQWTARCPRGNHPILISTTSETFGCPWCRRKGGVEELLAFAAEHNTFPTATVHSHK